MNKSLLLLLVLLGFLAAPFAPALASSERASATTATASKAVPPKNIATARKPTASAKQRAAAAQGKTVNTGQQARSPAAEMTPLRAIAVGAANAGDEAFVLRSGAALVLDQASGELIYAKNMDVPTSIASITKLMTAMVTLDAKLPMQEEITINGEDVDRLKGTGSRLALGTRLTREELLHLALIASENRAASALSRAYPGGRAAFVAAMNRKAREIGMQHARFHDATGLHSGNQATAADLARLVDAAYRYPLISAISTTASYDISVPGTQVVKIKENGKVRNVSRAVQRHIAFNNTNSLIREGAWDIGISKTGYIREAGHCLVMQTRIAEQKVIIVLLDAVGKWSRLDDATRIRKWLEQEGAQRLADRNHRNAV